MAKLKKLTKAKKQKIIKILKSVTIVIIIFTILLWPIQIPQYSFYYAACGFKKPVKIVEYGSQNYSYVLPDSPLYKNAILFVSGYYCSEQAAINAGYEKEDY